MNPPYSNTFVFVNDFAALLPDVPLSGASSDLLFQAEPVRGECRVICFSPRHDLTLAQMGVEEIASAAGIGRETAKSRLRYAFAKLCASLGT